MGLPSSGSISDNLTNQELENRRYCGTPTANKASVKSARNQSVSLKLSASSAVRDTYIVELSVLQSRVLPIDPK